jgi:transcriptional regulator with XRE-family HTH domain
MASDELNDLGQRVKKIRRDLGFSQQDFAKKLSLSGSFLSEIEAGKVKPGYDFIMSIAKEFRVNLYFLLFGKGNVFLETFDDSVGSSEGPKGHIDNFKHILWYAERSPMLMHTLVGFAAKYIYENKSFIDSEIERFNTKDNKDKGVKP